MQGTISERLSKSYREAVHVTLNRSLETDGLNTVLAAANAASIDVSINDLLIKAVGVALAEHPAMNAIYQDGTHELIKEVNIGVAVDVEAGLVTPVVPDVENKTVENVNKTRSDLTNRALSGDYTAEVLSGGTFTISNLGMFGIDDFDPIINPPEVAILGVGRIRDDGTMTVSLSFDHRVVNGADAARFLDTVVDTLTDVTALERMFSTDLALDGTLSDRTIRVETASGLAGRYRTAYGDVSFDEPEDIGGDGSAPSPVDHLLGALGSCLSLSVRQMAERDGVDIGEIRCDVIGSPEQGPLESVVTELELETEADADSIDTVIAKAKRACYVARSLSDDLSVSHEWSRL
jgi:pyruvate dehydrogenase E2 component (dihydrolipoamide acetyltransferase)